MNAGKFEVVDYDSKADKFFIVIAETLKLWEKEICPHENCKSQAITCYDHADTRSWRHMDIFGKRSEILCNVPRGKCPSYHRIYQVKIPSEGKGKHFTQTFERYALALMREMTVSKASDLKGECDQRMWRILFAHVDEIYSKLDMNDLVWIGADEMSARKGYDYMTVFADMMKKRVIFATEGKDNETFLLFADALYAYNGHPKAITQAAIEHEEPRL